MTEAGQKRIQSFAFVISVCAAVCFSWCFVANPTGSDGQDIIELDEKLNPNYAPTASLVRLPGIGISRAEAIVTYRQEFSKETGIESAFQNCDDLQKVKGIGPKTAESISQWLTFE